MTRPRITGLGALGFNVTTEYVESNRDVVRRVLNYLEDRRLLWGSDHDAGSGGHIRPEMEACRVSANMIRDMLSTEIDNVRGGGEVEASFKRLRTAARKFDTEAGIDSVRFFEDREHFERALARLRLAAGRDILALSQTFKIDLEPRVLAALPLQDLSFIPGFSREPRGEGD